MAANRYLLRLHNGVGLRPDLEVEANIDPTDDDALREKLEELVEARQGSLRLDLSRWLLRVHRAGGGMVVVTVTVDSAGRTVVNR